MYLAKSLIQLENLLDADQDFHSGANVIFTGMVRNHSEGKPVLYLEYEAYETMAKKMIRNLVERVYQKWPIDSVRLLHRIGRVNLGEIAVLIEVKSAHRDEAYQASRFLIESTKHRVPIWKKEYFADGTSQWSLCQHVHAGERVESHVDA